MLNEKRSREEEVEFFSKKKKAFPKSSPIWSLVSAGALSTFLAQSPQWPSTSGVANLCAREFKRKLRASERER